MRLQAGVARLPRGLGRKKLCHVRFGRRTLMGINLLAGTPTHQTGRFDRNQRIGQGELDALILADRPAKDRSVFGITGRTINKPIAITNALCGNQCPLCV